jgi:hypothetical protein
MVVQSDITAFRLSEGPGLAASPLANVRAPLNNGIVDDFREADGATEAVIAGQSGGSAGLLPQAPDR